MLWGCFILDVGRGLCRCSSLCTGRYIRLCMIDLNGKLYRIVNENGPSCYFWHIHSLRSSFLYPASTRGTVVRLNLSLLQI